MCVFSINKGRRPRCNVGRRKLQRFQRDGQPEFAAGILDLGFSWRSDLSILYFIVEEEAYEPVTAPSVKVRCAVIGFPTVIGFSADSIGRTRKICLSALFETEIRTKFFRRLRKCNLSQKNNHL